MAAVIKIELQSSGGAAEVKRDVESIGDAAEGAGKKFSALGEIATGMLRHIGTLAIDAAVAGISAIGGAISDGIEDAKNYAIIAAQTEAVITSTGEAAGVTAQHVADYASSLSDAAGKSLFGDDQIQESTNLLLTFTNIREKSLDAATAISVDMAQALGGAPKDAAIQLGKALNDPIAGITALTRVGVTFTKEQKATIQALQETGDMAGAQQVILDELNKEFGGSAEAAAAATGGWSEFNGRMGEAKETIGAAVLPLLNMLAGVLSERLLPIIETAATAFADLLANISEGNIAGIVEWFRDWANIDLSPVIAFIDTVRQMFEGGALAGVINALYQILPSELAGQITDGLLTIRAAFDQVLEVVGRGNDILATVINLLYTFFPPEVAAQITDALLTVRAVVDATFQHLAAVFSDSADPVQGFLNVLSEISPMFALVRGIIEAVLPPIQSIVESVFGNIATFLHAHGDDITAFLQQTWTQIQTIIQLALQLIQAIIVPILSFIASFIAAHGTEIQALLSNTWNAIKAVIDIALTLIQGVLKAALQIIQGDWSGAWETIKTMCARIVTDLVTVIQSGLNNAITLFGGMADQVISILSALPGQASALGGDIINGIIAGVNSMAGALLDTLRNMASDALQSWKDAILSSSPSKVFAEEGGKPIVEGLIIGVQSLIPTLMSVLDDVALNIISHAKKVTEKVVDEANKMQDALMEQAESIADKLGGVMSDALLGTASLDRAKAKAIGAIKDISAAQQEEVQKQLAAIATTAGGFGDPKQAAAFFKLRSDQIFELAKLRDQIDKTTDEAAKARLIEQYNLIGQAQRAELRAFDTKTTSSPLAAITEKLQSLLANPNLPAAMDDPTGALGGLFAALPQLVAMSGGNNPSASSTTNSSQFTYAPTVNTTAPLSFGMDYQTAKALATV